MDTFSHFSRLTAADGRASQGDGHAWCAALGLQFTCDVSSVVLRDPAPQVAGYTPAAVVGCVATPLAFVWGSFSWVLMHVPTTRTPCSVWDSPRVTMPCLRYFQLDADAMVLRRFRFLPSAVAKAQRSVDLALGAVQSVTEATHQPAGCSPTAPVRFALHMRTGPDRVFEAGSAEEARVWVAAIAELVGMTRKPGDTGSSNAAASAINDEFDAAIAAATAKPSTTRAAPLLARSSSAVGSAISGQRTPGSGTPRSGEFNFGVFSHVHVSGCVGGGSLRLRRQMAAFVCVSCMPLYLCLVVWLLLLLLLLFPLAPLLTPPPASGSGTPTLPASSALARTAGSTSSAQSSPMLPAGNSTPSRVGRVTGSDVGQASPVRSVPPPAATSIGAVSSPLARAAAIAAPPSPDADTDAHDAGDAGTVPAANDVHYDDEDDDGYYDGGSQGGRDGDGGEYDDGSYPRPPLVVSTVPVPVEEYDLVYERMQVLVLPPKDLPPAPAPTVATAAGGGTPTGRQQQAAQQPKLGLSLSCTPDGRVFVAAVQDTAGGHMAVGGGRKDERTRSRSRSRGRKSRRQRSTSRPGMQRSNSTDSTGSQWSAASDGSAGSGYASRKRSQVWWRVVGGGVVWLGLVRFGLWFLTCSTAHACCMGCVRVSCRYHLAFLVCVCVMCCSAHCCVLTPRLCCVTGPIRPLPLSPCCAVARVRHLVRVLLLQLHRAA